MLSAMPKKLKGAHVDLLRQVTGMKERRIGDKTWTKEGTDRVLQAAGTKPLREYIDKRQATVAEWVALRPIFEVCAKKTGYEGGGKLHEPWWRQAAVEQQLEATLKNIPTTARERRRQESDRHGGGEGGEEESVSGSDG